MSDIKLKTRPHKYWKKDFIIIPYQVYPFDLLVSWHTEYSDLEEVLKKRLPADVHKEIKRFKGRYDARTWMFKSGQTCVRFVKDNEGLIAHEVFHAVCALMEHIGAKLNRDSEECYAYLIGYITRKIYENFDEKAV